MYTLFGEPGWGSVLVETQLTWYGLPYRFEAVGNLFNSAAAREKLAAVNPLAQLPTLVLPGGRVMTESAAITLHLADITGATSLVPGPQDAQRAEFLRWLIFMVANIYPTFTYADLPDRFVPAESAQAFRHNVDAYQARLWQQIEDEASEPWFLGARFSALDIFIATMTQWRPKRPWFAGHRPRIADIAARTDAVPELAAVWTRNFPPA
jgi:GST-like protein